MTLVQFLDVFTGIYKCTVKYQRKTLRFEIWVINFCTVNNGNLCSWVSQTVQKMQKCPSGSSAWLPSAFVFVASYQFHICNGFLPLSFLPKQAGEKLQTLNKFLIQKSNHVNTHGWQNLLGSYSSRLTGSSLIQKM